MPLEIILSQLEGAGLTLIGLQKLSFATGLQRVIQTSTKPNAQNAYVILVWATWAKALYGHMLQEFVLHFI